MQKPMFFSIALLCLPAFGPSAIAMVKFTSKRIWLPDRQTKRAAKKR